MGNAEFDCGLAFVISGLAYVAFHCIKNLLCFQWSFLPSCSYYLLFLFSPPGPGRRFGGCRTRPTSPHHYQTNGECLARIGSKFEMCLIARTFILRTFRRELQSPPGILFLKPGGSMVAIKFGGPAAVHARQHKEARRQGQRAKGSVGMISPATVGRKPRRA